MNPSMCRQVFVDERASNSAAAGPSNQGAAMVMGHSEQQWRNWYVAHACIAAHAHLPSHLAV